MGAVDRHQLPAAIGEDVQRLDAVLGVVEFEGHVITAFGRSGEATGDDDQVAVMNGLLTFTLAAKASMFVSFKDAMIL